MYKTVFILEIEKAVNYMTNIFLSYTIFLPFPPQLEHYYTCGCFQSYIEDIEYDIDKHCFICFLGKDIDDDVNKLTEFYLDLGWDFYDKDLTNE